MGKSIQQLQAERIQVQERYEVKQRAVREGQVKFRRGEITARRLDGLEKNLDREEDIRTREFVRIDKEINDFAIRAAGASTARQKERKEETVGGVSRRFQELQFGKEAIARDVARAEQKFRTIVTPRGAVRVPEGTTPEEAEQAAQLVGSGLSAEEKIRIVRREGAIAEGVRRKTQADTAAEQRLIIEKEIEERRRRRALRIKLEDERDTRIIKKIQKGIGLFGIPITVSKKKFEEIKERLRQKEERELFERLGFEVSKEKGEVRAVKPEVEIVIKQGAILEAKGRVTGVELAPEFIGGIPEPKKEEEPEPTFKERFTGFIPELLATPAIFLETILKKTFENAKKLPSALPDPWYHQLAWLFHRRSFYAAAHFPSPVFRLLTSA
ncbi:hypothetical protein LCGC14_2544600, partial [marine sediment metagenome]